MKRSICTAMFIMATLPACALDLFNGRDFKDWTLHTTPTAKVEEVFSFSPGGVVASTGEPSGYLATRKSYRNYKLHVEWRWSGKPGNAGILLHISDGPMDRVWPLSLQVQTKRGSAGDILPMAGASFAEALTSVPGAAPRIKARTAPDSELAAGEWNVCDIVSRDGKVEVTLNGVLQNSVTGSSPAAGRVGFQLEGAPFELRKVALVELK
ncbi:MAG: DUF1080 domain-containing protein [Pseudomonadota bacterium]